MLESKTFLVWFGATLLMCAISCGQALSAQEIQHSIAKPVDTYRIGVGDRIQLDVWRHPELTRTVVVDSKGDITLPSVHVVRVSGLSPWIWLAESATNSNVKFPTLRSQLPWLALAGHWPRYRNLCIEICPHLNFDRVAAWLKLMRYQWQSPD
jgi:hypothetical protein